jgi:hypothetical protein
MGRIIDTLEQSQELKQKEAAKTNIGLLAVFVGRALTITCNETYNTNIQNKTNI